MALPQDTLSTATVLAGYEYPYSMPVGALEDYEMGGVDLNDGTQGLDNQLWHLTYNDDEDHPNYGDFLVTPELYGSAAVVLNVAGCSSTKLAFDQNMNPVIAYELKTGCAARFYWYDTATLSYVTTTLPAGSHSLQTCLDDHRLGQTGTSDVILAYMRAGTLYYRQQRDRYTVERSLKTGLGTATLRRVGMAKNLRLKFEVIGGSSTKLSRIVADMAQLVEFPKGALDVSALDEITVRGLLVAGVYNAADAIRSVQKTYFFDMPEVDGRLLAVLRGGDVVATIPQSDMVAGREIDLETAREQGVEFPRKLHVHYSPAENDYTTTKATSERRSSQVKAMSELNIDTPVNFEADEVTQIADKLHKVAWVEFEGKGTFAVGEEYAYLVPSDIISVEVRPGTYKRLRIIRSSFVDGSLEIEAVMDRQSAYTSIVSGATIPAPSAPPSLIPGATTWEYMDLPALLTSLDDLHYYVAGHGSAAAWTGAQLQRQIGSDWEQEGDIVGGELMGQVEEAVAIGSRYIPDTTNTLLVSLNDVPSSYTTALLLKGRGAWLVGNELVQVRDWVPEGDNWRGSYLLRGRLDTTPAAHSIGVRVVFMGNPVHIPVEVTLLDTTLTLRAPSYGSNPSDAASAGYSFTGKSQEEWAPVDLVATQDGSDWVLSWTPRHRLGSSANPVASTHFYGWRLRFTVGATTVVKTLDSTTAGYTYTSADQTADFSAPQSSFDSVEIRAMNRLGGEGKALSEAVS